MRFGRFATFAIIAEVTNPPQILTWTRSLSSPARIPLARVATYAALAGLMYTLVLCAWQCDDAYITFRTVKNFWSGFGLTWNPGERVQAYTHPLWMFVSLIVYGFTREVFFSMTFVAIGVTLATAMSLRQLCPSPFHYAVSLVVLIASRAFIDYSVCGLENPLLSGVLVASVTTSLPEPSRRSEWLRSACLSAVFLTRPDAILLAGPLWLALTWQRRALWRWSLLGLTPIAAWELFSLVYYGAWVPNTAIAKLNIAIPASRLALEGLHYFGDSLSDDPITLVVTGLAVVYAALCGELRARLLAAGVVLYLVYVVRIGGDFMSGRFLGAPLLVGLCALNLSSAQRTSPMHAHWARACSSAVTLAYVLLWPQSPLRSTLDYGRGYHFQPIADERAIYYPATGLLPVLEQYPELKAQQLPIPWTSTAEEGRAFARSKQHITVRADVGIVGFLAGEKLVIDTPGLADPLLARIEFAPAEHFRVGHYIRSLPDGYLESRAFGTNLIARPDLHEAYDAIVRVVRGPLFTAERWKAIWRLNTGYFEPAFQRSGP